MRLNPEWALSGTLWSGCGALASGNTRRLSASTPLVLSGQGAASARTVGVGLRLVHRGVRHSLSERGKAAAKRNSREAATTTKGGLVSFLENGLTVTVVVTTSLLACASAIAKPLPPKDGCRPVSKIEYNAAKREYLLNSRARLYIRTGPFWRRHYWHCPL